MVTLTVDDLRCACCAQTIAEAVRSLPGVTRAEVDLARRALRVDGAPDPDAVRAAVRRAGYRTAGDPASPSAGELAHAARMTPITCCTTCDRMQYIAIGAGTDVAVETANVVLMRSDPLDIAAAIRLSRATDRKMKQNLGWASIYNLLAIPVAAGVLYPSLGVELQPQWAALLMSVSSIVVATNAVLLRRAERELPARPVA
jgi:cation transport ATPase